MTDRVRRAYLPAALAPGGRALLDPDESHHVARVLRLRQGDALAVFDGRGGEWNATIEAIGREGTSVIVGEPRTGGVEAPLSVVLLQAFIRPEKLEWVLQKGTEIGIGAFHLAASARAEAPAPTPARLDRYRRIVLEAVKQCGRRAIPPIDVGALVEAPEGASALLLDPSADAPPLGDVLSRTRPRAAWIAVGPEGGFDAAEIATLARGGWRRVNLGPRILRTETAGTVAASLVLHAWGDLGAAGPAIPPPW